ncbi:hypothetical protein AU476_07300 [Cupriavidus sp. UYMSc13B]|nr:hypothetical protein AU476_07300 [Cupriavidus sp. UYMSc13B]
MICNRPPAKYFDWRRLFPVPDQFVTFSRDDLLKVCPLHKVFDNNGVIRFEQDGDLCAITISDTVQAVDATLSSRGAAMSRT